MQRKEFLKACGSICLGGIGLTSVLQGCNATKILSGKISGDDLVVPLSEFEIRTATAIDFKKYLVIYNDVLQYPICLYRKSEKEFIALWMRCTHLGSELQVFGEKLQCPAHGSEFDQMGLVQNGPADRSLRTFPVVIENNKLKISLKAHE